MVLNRERPNRLLWGLVMVSVGVHVLIYARISKCYSSNDRSYIELTLRQSASERPERYIPHPRIIKSPPLVAELPKRLLVAQRPVPTLAPTPVDPLSIPVTAASAAGVSVPQQPHLSAAPVADFDPKAFSIRSVEFDSKGAYLTMVRQRIETRKVYPDLAQKRHQEGRVTVGFTITPGGRIKDTGIVTYSPYQALNEAALKAVSAAGPFPPPPPGYFKGDIHLKVVIVFELT
jgi:periplasmic protein TonB